MPGTLLRSSLSGRPAWVTRGDLFAEGMGNSGQAGGFSTSGCQGSRKKVEVPEAISGLTPGCVLLSPFRFFRQLLSHTRCLWFPVVEISFRSPDQNPVHLSQTGGGRWGEDEDDLVQAFQTVRWFRTPVIKPGTQPVTLPSLFLLVEHQPPETAHSGVSQPQTWFPLGLSKAGLPWG